MNLNKLMKLMDFGDAGGPNSRRDFFRKASDLGVKATLAAIPAVVLSAMPKLVHAQSSMVTETLNFALTLEYLEDEFYRTALEKSTLIPSSDKNIFMQISKHETAHVAFLKTALGGSAVSKPTFDFTAGGMFEDVFSSYQTFLAVSQSFEDAGVRAYKGQAGNLISDNNTLKAALQIHSVEARHASEVRRLRGKVASMSIKGWITGKEANGAPDAIYAGEDNTTHASANLTSIAALNSVSMTAKTEAFDEPLTKEAVLAIVNPFLAPS